MAPKEPQIKRGGRRRRLAVLAIALALLVLAPFALIRSPLVKLVLLPRISDRLGVDVSASRVIITPDARIVATDVLVSTPGMRGPAAELMRIERLELESSWGRILSGSASVDRVLATRPVLRASRDRVDGSFNLASVSIEASDSPTTEPMPLIEVADGAIEFGEHLGDEYELLKRLSVEGAVTPTADTENLGYEIAFSEAEVSDDEGQGVSLRGRLAPTGIMLTLEGLVLADWEPEHVPAQYRELFALMQISGAIPRSAMSVGVDGSASFRVELEGVSLNLPFDAEGRQPESTDELIRLREVTGTIEVDDSGARASLVSLLGDLPAAVELEYEGLNTLAPFHCEITTQGFELSENPELLPLAPRIVVRRLADFSNPTATVNAHIVVQRGAPVAGVAAPMSVDGELAFHDCSAAFEGFPYRFEKMEGLARFDSEKIEIVGVTGVSASGARLHASGTIAPPLPGAAVDLKVSVSGAAINEDLLEAMGDRRRSIVEAMFNVDRYQQLVDAKLLRGDGAEGRDFAFGGVADINVHVLRELGDETDYTRTIEVRLPRAGVVPEPFPLPIIARDVVIEIGEDDARVIGGEFRGLSGGSAEVSARVDLSSAEDIGLTMDVRATGVRADELLLAALPGGLDPEPAPDSPAEVLRRVGLAGTIDCHARVEPDGEGDLSYKVAVDFEGMTARPGRRAGPNAEPVQMTGLTGDLLVTRERLSLQFRSDVTPVSQPGTRGTEIVVDTEIGLGDDSARPIRIELDAVLGDLTLAFEDLLATVSPDSAARLVELRERHRATGGVTASVSAAGDLVRENALDSLTVLITDCDRLAFDAMNERFVVDSEAGSLSLDALRSDSIRFDSFEARFGVPSESPARVRASGTFPLDRPWGADDELAITLEGAAFESRLVQRVLREALSEQVWRAATDAQLSGLADADLRISGRREDAAPPTVTGIIRPRRFEATLGGQRVSVPTMAGGVTLDGSGGAFEGCRLEADGWWAEFDGSWVSTGTGGALFDLRLDAESAVGLRPDVVALLPEGLRSVLGTLEVSTDRMVHVDDVAIRLTTSRDGDTTYRSSGRVRFDGLGAEIGVGIDDAVGYLDFEAESVPGAALPNFGVGIIADRLIAAGVTLRDAAVRVASHPGSGTVLVPVIVADAHGGRLSGSATIDAAGAAGGSYEAEIALSRVPLGELLVDWSRSAGLEPGDPGEAAPAEERGFVDAGITLSGELGEGRSGRRGRGTIQVGGGPVLRLPLLLPLIQVSNLQLPANARLDFGETVFFLDGDRVVFERASVFTESIEIFGYGQMALPGLGLDMRFKSRAVRRVPLVNRLLETFRDELVTTKVGGTLGEPSVSVEQFARTRRLLSSALGSELTPQEQRMLEIERLSREAVERQRRARRPSASAPRSGG